MEATMENIPDVFLQSDQPSNSTPAEQVRSQNDWKKGGRLLSGLVGSNILLFSTALLTCVFTAEIDIFEIDFLIFLTVIMALCVLWMIFQLYFTWSSKDAILYKDCEAGPIWMRGGIILFGLGTLIMTSLKIAYTVEFRDCITAVKVVQPVMQAIFIIVQTCFLWVSCKHCVQIYLNATRSFLMLLMALNLTIWIVAVTEESKHHTFELQKYFERNQTAENISDLNEERDEYGNMNRCECKYKCAFDKTVFIYLYPFNIEYNLFAAAMIYIMWKNVGRQIDENASFHHGLGPGVLQHVPILGLLSGLAILVTGLILFILYEVGRENTLLRWISITDFYIFHIISLFLMCLANLVGIIIFRLDKRSMDNQKNPSRTLDVVLLIGATLGQYSISYYSIIAMVSTQPFDVLCGLTFVYSVLMIVQHSIQNVFIIEGLHRLPPNNLLTSAHQKKSPSRQTDQQDSMRHATVENNDCRLSLRKFQEIPNRRMSRRETITQHIRSHLKKRKTMKDVYLFLFLCNIIFWIMPAFGARIRFDTGLEVKFYGFSLWAIITNICLPFGIFYRMHAAASLLELYSMS